LVAKGETLGLLVLEEPRDGEPFKDEEAAMLLELGAQIAVAIQNATLYAMAVTDGLTGLFVRRYFDLRMAEAIATARRYGRSFALMMLDIDHFKRFNDTHGHQTGDLVLKQFASLLKRNTRSSDICCRYGGEEMAIILPETGIDEAAVLANKLCNKIRRQEFQGMGLEPLSVTASIGVAAFRDAFGTAGDMVAAADSALYEAKELGRNRVELDL
jgi:diguanylate cyclase (GGDEF)-like protein